MNPSKGRFSQIHIYGQKTPISSRDQGPGGMDAAYPLHALLPRAVGQTAVRGDAEEQEKQETATDLKGVFTTTYEPRH